MPSQFSKVIIYYAVVLPSPQYLEGQKKSEIEKNITNISQIGLKNFIVSIAPRAYTQYISLLTAITPIRNFKEFGKKESHCIS